MESLRRTRRPRGPVTRVGSLEELNEAAGSADVSQGTLSDPEDHYATPVLTKSRKERVSSWRFNKIAEKRDRFKMSDLGGLKASITRTLKEATSKIDGINLLIKRIREDRALDDDAQETEMLRSELDDLMALDATINRSVGKGNDRCTHIEDESPLKFRWESYLSDNEPQFSEITKMIALIRSTLHRVEERSQRKISTASRTRDPEISGTPPNNLCNADGNQNPRNEAQGSASHRLNGSFVNLSTPLNIPRLRIDQHIDGTEYGGRNFRENPSQIHDQYGLEPELPRHFFKMELPVFEGHHYQWTYFWSMFNQYVHSKPYEDVIKLNILVKHCRGKALKYVESAMYSGSRYQGAIESLRRQFDNAYYKKSALLKSIEILPRAEDNSDSLDETLTTLKKYIGGLKGFEDVNTTYFRREIKCKFPVEVVLRLEKNERQILREWSTDELLEELETEVAMKRSEEEQMANSRQVELISHSFGARVSVNGARPRQFRASAPCVFCNRSSHRSRDCRALPDARTADRAVRQANLCAICLAPDHSARDCSQEKCANCGGNHWSKLCFKNESRGRTGNDSRPNSFQGSSVNANGDSGGHSSTNPGQNGQHNSHNRNFVPNNSRNPNQNGNRQNGAQSWRNSQNGGNVAPPRRNTHGGQNNNSNTNDCGPTPFRG